MPIPCVPGLLWQGNWIPPMRSYGGGNPSLTDIILQASGNIFPNHFVSSFDLALGQGLDGAAPADIAIVSKDLQAWYLLFVEPSIDSDAESLVERLELAQNHVFGPREARELARQMKEIDSDQAFLVVQNNPRLMVVTDDPHHQLYEWFSSSGVEVNVMVVEPFLVAGSYAIRINGDNATEAGMGIIGTCKYHELMSNCLWVTWTNFNEIPNPGPIKLKYGDKETQWLLLQVGLEWQLQPKDHFPLHESPPFEIVLDEENALSIRSSSP